MWHYTVLYTFDHMTKISRSCDHFILTINVDVILVMEMQTWRRLFFCLLCAVLRKSLIWPNCNIIYNKRQLHFIRFLKVPWYQSWFRCIFVILKGLFSRLYSVKFYYFIYFFFKQWKCWGDAVMHSQDTLRSSHRSSSACSTSSNRYWYRVN